MLDPLKKRLTQRHNHWGREEFISELLVRFPEVILEISDCSEGLLHMEMCDFARCTHTAIRAEDFITVQKHLNFVNEAFWNASAELDNAIMVSYLEEVFLNETDWTVLKARSMLSLQLVDALVYLESHMQYLSEAYMKKIITA
jgi:hypothetical protein